MRSTRWLTIIGVFTVALSVTALTLLMAGASQAAVWGAKQPLMPVEAAPSAPSAPTAYYTQSVGAIIPGASCPGGISSTITVDEGGLSVYDLEVAINVVHPHRGDLKIYLLSPTGQRAQLYNLASDEYQNLDVLFDQEAGLQPGDPGNTTHDPAAPSPDFFWKPAQNLGIFKGHPANGVWTIQVCDMTIADEGLFNYWGLSIAGSSAFPDISSARMSAPDVAAQGSPIEYVIDIPNTGEIAATPILTDYLPIGVEYVNGSLACNVGTCIYDDFARSINWNGVINPASSAQIIFQVVALDSTPFYNEAILDMPDLIQPIIFGDSTVVGTQVLAFWDFEGNNGGFISNTPPGEWEWGQPTYGPPNTVSGQNVWGTDLDNGYDSVTTSSLNLDFTIPVVGPEERVYIRWWAWYEISPVSAMASFQVNSTEWQSLSGSTVGWVPVQFDVTAYQGQTVNYAWMLNSLTDSDVFAGWYIDDVSIYTRIPTALSWEKEIWIDGMGPYSPDQAPFSVPSGSYVQTVDRIGPSSVPVSFTLTDQWTDALYLDSHSENAGSAIANPYNLTWTVLYGQVDYTFVATRTYFVSSTLDMGVLTQTLIPIGLPDPPVTIVIPFMLNADVDLGVAIVDHPDPAVVNQPVTYTVAVHNFSPVGASEVTLRDFLPPGVLFVSASPPGANCTLESFLSCALGFIPGHGTARVQIQVMPGATMPQMVNYATVSAAEVDPHPANNASTELTTILQALDTRPRIFAVGPRSGFNTLSTILIITGTNFLDGARVYLGDYPLLQVVFNSPQQLVATVPAGMDPGTYPLIVKNPDDQSGHQLRGFTVLADQAPNIYEIFPPAGVNTHPVGLDIYGDNFAPDDVTATISSGPLVIPLEGLRFIDSTHLRAMVPISVPVGLYDLNVYGPASYSATLPSAYAVLDPAAADDLFVHGAYDLWTRPPTVQTTETTLVGVNIRRRGGETDLNAVEVDYYRRLPNGDSAFLGRGTSGLLPPGGAITTTITWTVGMTPGLYTSYAIVDPDNKIPEYDETNNIVTRTLRVTPYDPASIPAPFLTINYGAQIADSPQVVLNVTTTQTADYILYVEYQYIQDEDNWRPVANSGWMPYADANLDYSWSLMPTSGIHYMQAWVADASGHISLLPGKAYINYLPPSDHVAEREVHIYRYQINAGERLLVRLSSLSGDADLYIWNPDGTLIDTSQTTNPVEELYIIATSAPRICQIEVEGATASDYSIEIVPQTTGFRPGDEPADEPGPLKPEGKGRTQPYSLLPPPDDVGLPEVPTIMLYLPTIMKY